LATNKIYRWTWTDPNTSWSCVLDFLAAATSNIPEDAEVIPLSMRGLLDLTWEWEYEDIYLGAKNNLLKVKLNINELPDIALHLKSPFASQNYNISFTNVSEVTNVVYKTGNVFKLTIKNSDGDTLLIEKFIQKTGIESGYDSGTYEMELDLIPIKRAVMEAMKWSTFYNLRFLTADMVDTKVLHYNSFVNNSISYSVGCCTGSGEGVDHRYWLVKDAAINVYTNEYYDSLYAKFNRESFSTFEVGLWMFPRMFRQTHNTTGALGSELSTTDIYRTAFYCDDTIANDGVMLTSMFDAYAEDYETFYDFWLDQSKQFSFILRTETINIDGKDLLERPKLTINADVVRRVNASLVGGFSDDVADYNTSSQSSGSEEQITVPVAVNTNTPITDDYELESFDNVHTAKFSITTPKIVHRTFDINWHTYYYYTASAAGHIADFYQKVHEYCVYNVGDGLYSDTVVTFDAVSRDLLFLNRNALLIPMQSEMGSSRIIADTVLHYLGQDNSVKIEGKIPLSRACGDVPELNWLTGLSEIVFDLSDFAPPAVPTFFDGLNNRFILMKASVSFKEYGFPVEFEALTRRAT